MSLQHKSQTFLSPDISAVLLYLSGDRRTDRLSSGELYLVTPSLTKLNVSPLLSLVRTLPEKVKTVIFFIFE
jgi:hypothetical protein